MDVTEELTVTLKLAEFVALSMNDA